MTLCEPTAQSWLGAGARARSAGIERPVFSVIDLLAV